MAEVRRVLGEPAPPIRRDKAAEVIADELRRLIVQEGSPGDQLPPERLLIERFGVSRPTLREALRVLESEGLVQIRRGLKGGAVIRKSSIDDLARVFGTFLQLHRTTIADIFVARGFIEPAAARLAAANPRAGAKLDAVLEREAKLLEDSGDEAMSEVITTFHDSVLELSGSHTLFALGKLLDALVQRDNLRKISLISAAGPESRQKGLRESHRTHCRLAEIIKSGDGEHAEQTMRKHLDVLWREFSRHTDGDETIDLFATADRTLS